MKQTSVHALSALFWIIATTGLFSTSAPAAEVGGRIAVLDFELFDDMKHGGHAPGHEDVLRRTQVLTESIRKAAAAGSRYEVIDLEPFADRYAQIGSTQARIHNCEPCYLGFAREVEADYVLTGWVQRVSNLIINFNMKIYDARTGELVDGGSIDIRGNTDKTWQDGTSYVIRRLRLGF